MKRNIFLVVALVLVVAVGAAIVFIDTANDTVEDVILYQSGLDNTSPVQSIIGSVQSNDIAVYIYWTEDGRFGCAAIKENASAFSRYSLCEVSDMLPAALLETGELTAHYAQQNLDFVYGVIANPESDTYIYEDEEYSLTLFDCGEFSAGLFLRDLAN